jgi:hypothetical protein
MNKRWNNKWEWISSIDGEKVVKLKDAEEIINRLRGAQVPNINPTKSYKKLVSELKLLGARWHVRYTGEQPRQITTAVIKLKDRYFVDTIKQYPHDKYNRNLARTLSLGRAFKAYRMGSGKGKEVPVESLADDLRFKEDRSDIIEEAKKQGITPIELIAKMAQEAKAKREKDKK